MQHKVLHCSLVTNVPFLAIDIHMYWVYAMDMMKQKAVRIAEQIHHKAKIRATQLGITLRAYVEDAVSHYGGWRPLGTGRKSSPSDVTLHDGKED